MNGQQFSSQPLKLTVTQPNAPPAAAVNSGDEIVFMKLSLPQKKIYAGQMLTKSAIADLFAEATTVQNFTATCN